MMLAMENSYSAGAEAKLDRDIEEAVGKMVQTLDDGTDNRSVTDVQELIAQRARMMREPWDQRRATRMERMALARP